MARQGSIRSSALVMLAVLSAALAASTPEGRALTPRSANLVVIPKPVSMVAVPGKSFRLSGDARLVVPPGSPGAADVGRYLAELLRRSTGYALPVAIQGAGALTMSLIPAVELGREGYRLDVAPTGVRLLAGTPEGLFRGVQTFRQLLPAQVEAAHPQSGPWTIPAVRIMDRPRFAWRGAMLDVARRFLKVSEVKRYLDLIALYKINTLHLHLSDDQGWRLQIKSWPRLATYGGGTSVGGGPGGHYTQRDYEEIVQYAADRFITIVPEIDGPAHMSAALASYPELNCEGKPTPRQTAPIVFSSMCVRKEVTYRFLRDVFGELAALTPAPYIHLGGDEAFRLSRDDYAYFIGRVQRIVRALGKTVVGWHETARTPLPRDSIVQYWGTGTGSSAAADPAREAVRRGARLVLSPANRTYLDMKYHVGTPYGHFIPWAGFIDVRQMYEWDPATLISGIADKHVLGVEAPLWSEGISGIDQVEFMAFPRLPGIAEVGWSPSTHRSWAEYRHRLAAQDARWRHLSLNRYRSAQVPWP